MDIRQVVLYSTFGGTLTPIWAMRGIGGVIEAVGIMQNPYQSIILENFSEIEPILTMVDKLSHW